MSTSIGNEQSFRKFETAMKTLYFCYRFICLGTIEEKIKKIQEVKLNIANTVLSGIQSVSARLTLDDMKSLFAPN